VAFPLAKEPTLAGQKFIDGLEGVLRHQSALKRAAAEQA